MYKSFSIKRTPTFISTASTMFIDTNDLCDAVLFDRDGWYPFSLSDRKFLVAGKTLLIFGKNNKKRSIVERCGS